MPISRSRHDQYKKMVRMWRIDVPFSSTLCPSEDWEVHGLQALNEKKNAIDCRQDQECASNVSIIHEYKDDPRCKHRSDDHKEHCLTIFKKPPMMLNRSIHSIRGRAQKDCNQSDILPKKNVQ